MNITIIPAQPGYLAIEEVDDIQGFYQTKPIIAWAIRIQDDSIQRKINDQGYGSLAGHAEPIVADHLARISREEYKGFVAPDGAVYYRGERIDSYSIWKRKVTSKWFDASKLKHLIEWVSMADRQPVKEGVYAVVFEPSYDGDPIATSFYDAVWDAPNAKWAGCDVLDEGYPVAYWADIPLPPPAA